MIEEINASNVDSIAEEVNRFHATVPSTHYKQTIDWLKITTTGKCRLFITRDQDDKIVATSVCVIPKSKIPLLSRVSVPRGPVASSVTAMCDHLTALRVQLKGHFTDLRVSPYVKGQDIGSYRSALSGLGFQQANEPNVYEHTLECRVLPDQRAQWQTFRRSLRTSINKAQKLGVTVAQRMDMESYASFGRRYSDFATQRGIAAHTVSTANLFSRRSPHIDLQSVLLGASLGGRTIGEILLVRNGQSLIFEWGWTDESSVLRNVPVMHLLFLKAIDLCREHDISTLDFGGIWNEPGSVNSIDFFKSGFTDNIVSICPEHLLVLSPIRHFSRQVVRRLTSRFEPKLAVRDASKILEKP